MIACFSSKNDTYVSTSAILRFSCKTFFCKDVISHEPSGAFDYKKWDNLFELLDDLFQLLSLSTSLVQLYNLFLSKQKFIYCFKPAFVTFICVYW